MNKIKEIYDLLYDKFGSQRWWPVFSDNHKFEIAIGAILTQNTLWSNVERVIKILKQKDLISKEAIQKIKGEELASLIKSSGYYKQKAKKLKEFARFLDSGKEINRENLLNIWGIGPETADSILLYAYEKSIFVVDAYTKRIFNRLGFKQKSYEELQELFMKNLDCNASLFNEYHALLVRLGKEYCKKIPSCGKCPINRLCKQVF